MKSTAIRFLLISGDTQRMTTLLRVKFRLQWLHGNLQIMNCAFRMKKRAIPPEGSMYHRAEICLPRKKKVRESYRSNTNRIFDEKAPDRLNPDEFYSDHRYESRDRRETEMLKTHNIPQPSNIRFLRSNARFFNEPIAHVETEGTMAEQFKWWSNVLDKDMSRKTVYSKDSTQRMDYQPITNTVVTRVRGGRHRPPATGIIPTLSPLGQPKELVEHMSFLHQYDCRRMHDQPYQGKRLGAFVWSERGARDPITFHSTAGLRSPSEGRVNGLTSPQQALLCSQQMCVSTGALSSWPGPAPGSPYSGTQQAEWVEEVTLPLNGVPQGPEPPTTYVSSLGMTIPK